MCIGALQVCVDVPSGLATQRFLQHSGHCRQHVIVALRSCKNKRISTPRTYLRQSTFVLAELALNRACRSSTWEGKQGNMSSWHLKTATANPTNRDTSVTSRLKQELALQRGKHGTRTSNEAKNCMTSHKARA